MTTRRALRREDIPGYAIYAWPMAGNGPPSGSDESRPRERREASAAGSTAVWQYGSDPQ